MWRELAQVSMDWILGTVALLVIGFLLIVTASVSWLVVTLVPLGWLLFELAEWMGRVERSRAATLLDLPLPSPHLPLTAPTRLGRLRQRATSRSRWREIGYLILLPFVSLIGIAALFAWAGSLMLLFLPGYVARLPGGQARFGVFTVGPGVASAFAALLGALGLILIAPWLTVAAAGVDRSVVRRLLGPSERAALTERVRRAEARRSVAVESAETERQRIERDLHDGAQQRLVALAMDLGRAREQFERDPERARQLITEAHEEAKAALTELRDLVRGIHPAVLSDRGLDAALSAVVARVDIPVDLDVRVPRRLPPAVESTAYFVVTEALTNVVRHSLAHRAGVAVSQAGGRLLIEVSDDGMGGADPAKGTGLAGLAARVESVGGWLHIVSPPGGPTTLMAEIPCAS